MEVLFQKCCDSFQEYLLISLNALVILKEITKKWRSYNTGTILFKNQDVKAFYVQEDGRLFSVSF